MTWSPLACGILTGKYEDGIPLHSRASLKAIILIKIISILKIKLKLKHTKFKGYSWLKEKILNEDGKKKQEKIKELQGLAEKLGCTLAQLSIGILHAVNLNFFINCNSTLVFLSTKAWCVKNESVNCIILGASTLEQLYENIQSLQVSFTVIK